MSLMLDFADLSLPDLFDDTTATLDSVRDIMYRWAGVDGVDPESRGPNIDARLTAQSAGRALFEGSWYYNIATDSFDGITGLDADILDDLETLATGLADTAAREVFWGNVVRMVHFGVGVTALPGADQPALDAAIAGSDAGLSLSGILGGLLYVSPEGDTINGTSGNDVLIGGLGNEAANDNLSLAQRCRKGWSPHSAAVVEGQKRRAA